MWRMTKEMVDENMIFMSPNIPPNWTCCMSACNCAWIFSRIFDIWILALSDDNEYFQDGVYMSNNWHFIMVGSCVTTMNIKNAGSCINNIHFIICSLAVMIFAYFYWKIYAINVHKETSLSIRKTFLIFVNHANMYINAYEEKCNRVSLEKKC